MKCNMFKTIFIILAVIWPITVSAAYVGDTMPEFSIETLDGQAIKSNEIRGEESLMLIFWATWCPNCKKEIPLLNSLFSEFSPKGMRFLGINVGVNDSVTKVKRYAEKYKINYPLTFDEGSKLTRRFNVQGTPTIIIIDRQGTVQYRDAVVPEELGSHFEKLMM